MEDERTPLISKNRLSSASNCEAEMESRPVLLSSVAPVALTYASYASVAR